VFGDEIFADYCSLFSMNDTPIVNCTHDCSYSCGYVSLGSDSGWIALSCRRCGVRFDVSSGWHTALSCVDSLNSSANEAPSFYIDGHFAPVQ
jgi:hypothetical protein